MATATPELGALGELVSRLDRAGIAYMLTGSLAMAYYARPRMTRDIDVVVAMPHENAAGLAGALSDVFFVDADAMVEAFRHCRPCNVLHLATLVKVDLIPRKPGEFRETEFARRRNVEISGIELWIVSPEDLVLAKLDWARDSRSELQMRDVALLLDTPLDREYLETWAERIGVGELLRQAPDA
jgi:hypothetical protein